MDNLLQEVNEYSGTSLRFLAEIDAFRVKGAGKIFARYITKFTSESVRSYLIPQIVSDKVEDCDKLILRMYMHFKASNEYLSIPGVATPAHIYVRYDNAFKTLKPKRIKNDLVQLAHNPRDVFYLPFTMRMLASWKLPEIKDLFIFYLASSNIFTQDVEISEYGEKLLPPIAFMTRELRFTAIHGLKYYPSDDTIAIIKQYVNTSDPDIRAVAQRTLMWLERARRGDGSAS